MKIEYSVYISDLNGADKTKEVIRTTDIDAAIDHYTSQPEIKDCTVNLLKIVDGNAVPWNSNEIPGLTFDGPTGWICK